MDESVVIEASDLVRKFNRFEALSEGQFPGGTR